MPIGRHACDTPVYLRHQPVDDDANSSNDSFTFCVKDADQPAIGSNVYACAESTATFDTNANVTDDQAGVDLIDCCIRRGRYECCRSADVLQNMRAFDSLFRTAEFQPATIARHGRHSGHVDVHRTDGRVLLC